LASIYPGAPELCDGLDNDCDGRLSASEDADGDGWARASCGAACVGSCGDCDDSRSYVYPGAPELCDGRDNDCDGALSPTGEDDDGDGHADAACGACTGVCDDCDDEDDRVHPGVGAVAPCDGIDNDCDGTTDEMDGLTTGPLDKDGYRDTTQGIPGPNQGAVWDGSEFGVIVTESAGAGIRLRLYKLDAALQQVRGPYTLASDAVNNRIPAMVWTGSIFIYTYVSDLEGNYRVYVGGVGPDGVEAFAPVEVHDPSPNNVNDGPRVVWDGTNALVYWRQPGGGPYVRAVSPSGALGSLQTVGHFRVVSRPGGGFLYLRPDTIDDRIYFGVLGSDGTPTGSESFFATARTPNAAISPTVVSGRIMLTVGHAGSGFSVYALDTDGAVLAGPTFQAVSDGNYSGQSHSQITTTGHGDRVVVTYPVVRGPYVWEFDTTTALRSNGFGFASIGSDFRTAPIAASDGLSHYVAITTAQAVFTCH
jgi:hypothetical protein